MLITHSSIYNWVIYKFNLSILRLSYSHLSNTHFPYKKTFYNRPLLLFSKFSIITKGFPSLFSVDANFEYWTTNNKTANKKIGNFKKAVFEPKIWQIADKNVVNNKGRLFRFREEIKLLSNKETFWGVSQLKCVKKCFVIVPENVPPTMLSWKNYYLSFHIVIYCLNIVLV
jgi:hypothetical protein